MGASALELVFLTFSTTETSVESTSAIDCSFVSHDAPPLQAVVSRSRAATTAAPGMIRMSARY